MLKHAREARDEAERHSRLKDEFLATLSHELRTPMNAILGWLAILDTGKPIRDVHSALAVIRRNSEMQAKLIEDLLDMNRLVSGNVQLDIVPVDLGALSQATMQALQPAAEAKGVKLLAVVVPVRRCAGTRGGCSRCSGTWYTTPSSSRRRADASTSRCIATATGSKSRSRTPARASRPRSCRTCSSASVR